MNVLDYSNLKKLIVTSMYFTFSKVYTNFKIIKFLFTNFFLTVFGIINWYTINSGESWIRVEWLKIDNSVKMC